MLDAHQPFILAHVFADFAGHVQQVLGRGLNVTQHLIQRAFRNTRISAQYFQCLLLPLQFLQQVRFHIGPAGYVENLKQRNKRGVVLKSVVLGGKESYPVKQILKPQQGADTLVKRMLVANHVNGQSCGRKRVGMCDIALQNRILQFKIALR